MLSGWAEIGFRDEALFEKLATIVIEKQSNESFFAKGDTIAMVNILKAMSEIDLENDEFLTTILEPVVENFNELTITWAITLIRTLGTMSLGNQELLLASMTQISQTLHKKLKNCYDAKAEVSIEDIPDFTDYHSLWLSL